MKGFIRSVFFLSLVILLSFWTVKPLFHPGFFPMHDDTQASRIYEMAKALSFGQFPVRWVGDLGYGYGYPLFNFYAPLPYYIGAVFNLFGFEVITATKLMFFIGIVFAGVTMFLLLANLVGEVPATVGSILYMYAPYRAVDIYVRGAVGEFYALAFLPLVLLGIVEIIRVSRNDPGSNSRRNDPGSIGIIVGSLGIAGVFLSHNILGMITGYFLILFLLILFIVYLIPPPQGSTSHTPGVSLSRGAFKALLFTFLLGLGLSAFFILPALAEKNFTRVNELTTGTNNFANHFVYLDQLWSSPWGYAGSASERADGMSFMIGKIHLLLGVLSIPIIFILHKRKKINNFQFGSPLGVFNFQLILFLLSVFLMLDISKPIWNLVPGFPFIQYPWRFLTFAVFSLSIIGSMVLILFSKNTRIIISSVLIVLAVWFNSKYFIPKEYLNVSETEYVSDLNLRYKISKISDEYLPNDFLIPKSTEEISWQGLVASANMRIRESFESPIRKIYTVDSVDSDIVQTSITYFPGWQAYIDKKHTPIQSKNGRIEVAIPEGRHEVEFIFKDTPVRKIANTISIFALFLLLYISCFAKTYLCQTEKKLR